MAEALVRLGRSTADHEVRSYITSTPLVPPRRRPHRPFETASTPRRSRISRGCSRD